MFTNEKLISEISNILGIAAKNVSDKIIQHYGNDIFMCDDTIEGRETEITPSLATEITFHLLDEVVKLLDGKNVEGIFFKVQAFKQSEEKRIGADLLGLLSINFNGQTTTKFYLAQAKIGKRRNKGTIYSNNPDILKQANTMLSITPDSFFFLYTENGIEVISAFPISLYNKSIINTQNIKTKLFQDFYIDFFDCFIGDNRIERIIDLSPKEEIPRPIDINILYIQVDIKE